VKTLISTRQPVGEIVLTERSERTKRKETEILMLIYRNDRTTKFGVVTHMEKGVACFRATPLPIAQIRREFRVYHTS